MHYQRPPHAEMKLVSCLRGEVWDVALDLRHGSPTFLQWHAEHLSADNGCALLIPPGFAHGFQTLGDDTELLYCHSVAHAPTAEAGCIRWTRVWPSPGLCPWVACRRAMRARRFCPMILKEYACEMPTLRQRAAPAAFLDLGSAPPSNAYLSAAALRAPETWFPLRLLVCESCWLVQTEDHAGARGAVHRRLRLLQLVFFFVARPCAGLCAGMRDRLGWTSAAGGGGCLNDGYLLQYVQAAGIPCYGIEPTASTAAAARAKGIAVVERFLAWHWPRNWRPMAASRPDGGNNVLAHVPDINDFVGGFARLLKPHGVATFEFPHLLRMVQGCQFDTAYHEHYSYLSLTAVQRIFAVNGLAVLDVQELPTHGAACGCLPGARMLPCIPTPPQGAAQVRAACRRSCGGHAWRRFL